MSRARVSLELVHQIHPKTRAEMYRLFETYYQNATEQAFQADLADKDLALLVRSSDSGAIVGFTTILRQKIFAPDGSPATAVFSGDTVMDKEFWGSKILQWEFTRYLLSLKLSAPHRRLYWMLMSKGFKTYLMIRRNCPRTFPGHDLKDDCDLRIIRDIFYSQRYRSAFDPRSGLVRFAEPRGAIASAYADVDPSSLADLDINHFFKLNPHYRTGVELACVAEVRLRDFPVALTKYLGKAATRIIAGGSGLRKAE